MSESINFPTTELISLFPEKRDVQRMSDMDMAIVTALEYSFKIEDGKTIVRGKDGQIVRDPINHNPLGAKEVIGAFFEKRGWLTQSNSSAAGSNFSSFRKSWIEQNPNKDPNGPEFQKDIAAHAKDKIDFNWHI